ncbi:hypothetical protein UT300001_27680 [Clostridium sp. CTA-1]
MSCQCYKNYNIDVFIVLLLNKINIFDRFTKFAIFGIMNVLIKLCMILVKS